MKHYKEANDGTPIDVPNPMMRDTLGSGLQGSGPATTPFLPFLPPWPFPRIPNTPVPGPLSNPFKLPGQYEESIIVNGVPGARVYGRRFSGNLGALAAPDSAYGQPADQQPW